MQREHFLLVIFRYKILSFYSSALISLSPIPENPYCQLSSDPLAAERGSKSRVPALGPVPDHVTNSEDRRHVAVLTCHGVFPGSVFSFSSVVSGIAASGFIVCFPFFEADHFPR